MNHVFAVLFLAVAAQATDHPLPQCIKDMIDTKGEQYKLYDELTKLIKLDNAKDGDNAFTGLNILSQDEVVKKNDLEIFYWHSELQYAIKKFTVFIEGQSGNEEITPDELKKKLSLKAVQVALIECTYLKSKGLKQSCFADQLLTYASLVLEFDDISKFYQHIANGDGAISVDDVKKYAEGKKQDHETTAEELGAYTGAGVTIEEFTDYVTQETINDDFRRCRDGAPNVDSGNVKFTTSCLVEELVEYTNDDLTEMDIAVLFHAVDTDGNKEITTEELKKLPNLVNTPEKADAIMKLLDMSLTAKNQGKPVIDYGEFRTYMRTPTVQLQAERDCTEKYSKQVDEMGCLYNLFVKLVTQEHDAIWLVVPDLEQQIAFEIVDASNNGTIEKTDLKFNDVKTKDKFLEEFDADNGKYVCLEEWNEYMDVPHMVYGTGDCLLKKRDTNGRGACYPHEVEDIIDNIKHFNKDFWTHWFKFYDSNGDNIITSADKNEQPSKFGTQALEKLFLLELGQGDDTVTLFEFTWYVKQQELADRYESLVTDGKPEALDKFHKVLEKWIKDDITEYDIQQFFDALDTDKNDELEGKDFPETIRSELTTLLHAIDSIDSHGDEDKTVNFREFWLWLNIPTNNDPKNKKYIKDIFEENCTEKEKGDNQQENEVKCYKEYFEKNVSDLVSKTKISATTYL